MSNIEVNWENITTRCFCWSNWGNKRSNNIIFLEDVTIKSVVPEAVVITAVTAVTQQSQQSQQSQQPQQSHGVNTIEWAQ